MQYLGLLLPTLSLIITFVFAKEATRFDRTLRWILALMMLTESLGHFAMVTDVNGFFIYNIYPLILFILYISLYIPLIKSAHKVRLIKKAPYGLVLFFLLDNWVFQDFFTIIQSHTFIFGALLIILVITIYLLELMESDLIIDFYNSKVFWVSLGMLLFHIPFIPVIVCLNLNFLEIDLIKTIILSLNLIMHAFFIVAYVKTKRK